MQKNTIRSNNLPTITVASKKVIIKGRSWCLENSYTPFISQLAGQITSKASEKRLARKHPEHAKKAYNKTSNLLKPIHRNIFMSVL